MVPKLKFGSVSFQKPRLLYYLLWWVSGLIFWECISNKTSKHICAALGKSFPLGLSFPIHTKRVNWNILGFVEHEVFITVNYSTLPIQNERSYGRHINEWACSGKTFLVVTGGGLWFVFCQSLNWVISSVLPYSKIVGFWFYPLVAILIYIFNQKLLY